MNYRNLGTCYIKDLLLSVRKLRPVDVQCLTYHKMTVHDTSDINFIQKCDSSPIY